MTEVSDFASGRVPELGGFAAHAEAQGCLFRLPGLAGDKVGIALTDFAVDVADLFFGCGEVILDLLLLSRCLLPWKRRCEIWLQAICGENLFKALAGDDAAFADLTFSRARAFRPDFCRELLDLLIRTREIVE